MRVSRNCFVSGAKMSQIAPLKIHFIIELKGVLGDSCWRSHLTCLHRLLSFQVSAVCRAESGCVFALTKNVSVYLMNSDRKGQCGGDNGTENTSDIMVIQIMSKLYLIKLSWLAIDCLFSCVDTAKWLGSKRERGERERKVKG